MYKTMWIFNTPHFIIKWQICPDNDLDLFWDESGEVREKLESGEYVAFGSIVTVTHIPSGIVLGEDSLWGSIYDDPAKFRDHFGCKPKGYGSYFSDLVRGAVSEARRHLAQIKETAT